MGESEVPTSENKASSFLSDQYQTNQNSRIKTELKHGVISPVGFSSFI